MNGILAPLLFVKLLGEVKDVEHTSKTAYC
jgi:hypothetical protein